MKSLTLIRSTLVVGVVGCALPMLGGSPATPAVALAVAGDTGAPPPVVQVRAFPKSSVVSVVAWDADDAAFGLRTSVTRTGELVSDDRFGDHRLYLTPLFVHEMGGFTHAAVTPGQLLLGTGWQRDEYACFYGKDCSPIVTLGVRVPDSLLRANRDSLVITFSRVGDPWMLTLRRELIAAYLKSVDSVVAETRRLASK